MTASPWVRDVTEADFQTEVLDASHDRPIVVDFWAPWCGPCKMLGPVLEEVVGERNGEVILAKVNTDESPGLAEEFQISAIPAVKAFRNGQVVVQFEGVRPAAALRQFLDAIMPGEGEQLLSKARTLEQQNPAEAEAIYRDALTRQADLDEARLGLARVLLAQGKLDEVPEVLEPVAAEGAAGTEATRLQASLALTRLASGLPEEAVLRQRLAANPQDARTRYELGVVLARRGDFPGALEMLLSAGEKDFKLASGPVREAMVQVFYALASG
jgi:putative thioredoxin